MALLYAGRLKVKKEKDERSDLEECKAKIAALLKEYNCTIETDDYAGCWMRDKDTDETIGMRDA
tara:strand:- start:188 stop:379 length:192 start_codon:yes stop_codon:yes gene_type:complete